MKYIYIIPLTVLGTIILRHYFIKIWYKVKKRQQMERVIKNQLNKRK